MKQARQQQAEIGAHMRVARERLKITKEEAALAAKAQVSAITAWERGSSSPTLVQLKGLLECYGVSCHQLLFGRTPLELDGEDAAELRRAEFSPRLRAKMDLLLALVAKPGCQTVAS